MNLFDMGKLQMGAIKTATLINEKCFGCFFCLWYQEWQEYRCGILGCYEGSKFKHNTSKQITNLSVKRPNTRA